MAGWVCLHNFHQIDEAEKHHRRGLDICVKMAREQPQEKEWLGRQARAWRGLAETFNAAGKPENAIETGRQLVFLLERAEVSRYDQGKLIHLLAFLLRKRNPEEAETLHRRAIAVFREHLRQEQVEEDSRRSFAQMLQTTATFFETRHPEEVEALLDEGISVMRDELAAPFTRQGFFSPRFVMVLRQQSGFLRRLAIQSGVNPEQARQHLAKAQSLRLEIIDTQRKIVAFNASEASRYELVKTLQEESAYLLGSAATPIIDPTHAAKDRHSQADAMLTEAIQLCRVLAAEIPEKLDYKTRLTALEKLQAEHFEPKVPSGSGKPPTAQELP
jgi:hypothetical protein